VKAAFPVACFVISAAALTSCERDEFNSDEVTGYLKEDASKIESLEHRVSDLETKIQQLEKRVGE
jgi:hypothetical protein